MTSTKTNTSHSIISNSSNKRSLDTDHDNDDEDEEEEEWVGPMSEIAEKTSQDSRFKCNATATAKEANYPRKEAK